MLQHIELRFADVSPSAAAALAGGLTWLSRLLYLDLSECRIKDKAVAALIPALVVLPALRSVDLSSTGVQVRPIHVLYDWKKLRVKHVESAIWRVCDSLVWM